MANRYGYVSEERKKIEAITNVIHKSEGGKKTAIGRHIAYSINMTSHQFSGFVKKLKGIVKSEKNKDNYKEYYVKIPEIPNVIRYGDEWVKIEDKGDYYKITSSLGDEFEVDK